MKVLRGMNKQKQNTIKFERFKLNEKSCPIVVLTNQKFHDNIGKNTTGLHA